MLCALQTKSLAHRVARGQVSRGRHAFGGPALGARPPGAAAAPVHLPHAHTRLPARLAACRARRHTVRHPRLPRRQPACVSPRASHFPFAACHSLPPICFCYSWAFSSLLLYMYSYLLYFISLPLRTHVQSPAAVGWSSTKAKSMTRPTPLTVSSLTLYILDVSDVTPERGGGDWHPSENGSDSICPFRHGGDWPLISPLMSRRLQSIHFITN